MINMFLLYTSTGLISINADITTIPVEDRKLRIKFEFDPELPRLGKM